MTRGMVCAGLVLAGILALVVPGGCAWFEDEPPDRSCEDNEDCFRAQGEVCDRARKTCVQAPDAGADAAEEPDAGADAAEDAADQDGAADAQPEPGDATPVGREAP